MQKSNPDHFPIVILVSSRLSYHFASTSSHLIGTHEQVQTAAVIDFTAYIQHIDPNIKLGKETQQAEQD